MSPDEDFYVEDEPIEDVRASWRRGEKGVTTGPRDLNQRAKSIVDRAVAMLDAEPEAVHVTTEVVDAAGWFGVAADAETLKGDMGVSQPAPA